MQLTPEQLAGIQARLTKLLASNADANDKTQASNQADSEVSTALAVVDQKKTVAAQAKLNEATADAAVTADLTDLSSFLDSLVAPPPAG